MVPPAGRIGHPVAGWRTICHPSLHIPVQTRLTDAAVRSASRPGACPHPVIPDDGVSTGTGDQTDSCFRRRGYHEPGRDARRAAEAVLRGSLLVGYWRSLNCPGAAIVTGVVLVADSPPASVTLSVTV
jgi:hypothetical protein